MKLDMMNREQGLQLFGKLIRTKNIDGLQGDQGKPGPEPAEPPDSKQKLQVRIIGNIALLHSRIADRGQRPGSLE